MSKSNKKAIREKFRNACFARDRYRCAMCGHLSTPSRALEDLDAHHITDRNELPNGGYVPENGISLCAECHLKAEVFHSTGTAHPGYSPEDLYQRIGSARKRAWGASEALET